MPAARCNSQKHQPFDHGCRLVHDNEGRRHVFFVPKNKEHAANIDSFVGSSSAKCPANVCWLLLEALVAVGESDDTSLWMFVSLIITVTQTMQCFSWKILITVVFFVPILHFDTT